MERPAAAEVGREAADEHNELRDFSHPHAPVGVAGYGIYLISFYLGIVDYVG